MFSWNKTWYQLSIVQSSTKTLKDNVIQISLQIRCGFDTNICVIIKGFWIAMNKHQLLNCEILKLAMCFDMFNALLVTGETVNLMILMILWGYCSTALNSRDPSSP